MAEKTPERQLVTQLAERTGTHAADWFLVYKARFGMELVFRVLTELRGHGEIITQPFTCITAVNPIISSGNVPIYVDTSPDTLSLDTKNLQASKATRALIVQHTCGIPANMAQSRSFADKHGLLLLEDSAQKLGLLVRLDETPAADVSVHSFGLEKMLPTKFGAAVWVNPELADTELRDALKAAFVALPHLDKFTNWRAKNYRTTNRLLNHVAPLSLSHWFRRTLTTMGLFEAPIMPSELQGHNSGIPTKPSTWMVKKVLAALQSYELELQTRIDIGELYRTSLAEHPTLKIPTGIQPNDALTRFPLICASAEQANQLFALLTEKKLSPGKWYRPTLFPGPENAASYNYDREAYPVAEDLSARVINLRTKISLEKAKEIIDALNR